MDSTDQREENINVSETQFNDRVDAPQFVERNSIFYNMNHKHRGQCLIFSNRFLGYGLYERKSAELDTDICKNTFERLGYEVHKYFDYSHVDLMTRLVKVSQEDHSDSDSLVIIFMSHGVFKQEMNQQLLSAIDKYFLPSDLWEPFYANKCPTLAGKPKLFFIQACRGDKTDKGVRCTLPTNRSNSLVCSTDGISETCVLPSSVDILVMWATYPGYYAFKSEREDGAKVSVFIHFLTKILDESGLEEELSSLLLTITRSVALDYESKFEEGDERDKNKQVPYTESTLMRRLRFTLKNKNI